MDTLGTKILKVVVIVMALLLLVGTTALIMRFQDRQKHATPVEKIPAMGELQLAPNGRVVMMVPVGGGVALLVNSVDANQELVLLDPQGGLVRRIRMAPLPMPDAEK